MIADIDFVGFKVELQNIMLSLVDGPKELDVLSLVGMPGNGKTTLAQKLYQDPIVRRHFDILVWCTVSQLYQKREFWHTILCQLDSNCEKMVDEDGIAERIAQKLKRRRYLIIIDDIWDIKPWNDLKRYLPNDNNGSRILITTRHQDVASQTSSVQNNVHSLRLFTVGESYELLERKSGLKEYHSDEQLLQVGHQIALSCKGLPLAIVVVAGHLAKAEKNVEEWKQLLARLSSRILNDKERPYKVMLEWSYDCLPTHLKSCFLYAGVLGAYKPVHVWKLKLMWIAEGFVRDNKFESLEKQAEDYLMDLVNRSLVIPTKGRSIGGVKEFRMHDLLKDFCLQLSEEQSFMHKINKFSWHEPYESEDVIHVDQTRIDGRRCDMSFDLGYHVGGSLLIFQDQAMELDGIYAALNSVDSKIVQVLDISGVFIIDDILGRVKLVSHLKYFAVDCLIFYADTIPSLFASFRKLQTLILDNFGSGNEATVPDCLWDMENLRIVHVTGESVRFQVESSRLEKCSFPENIETLSTPLFSSPSDADILGRLTMLRKLSCSFDNCWGDSTNCYQNLDFLTQLMSLKVSWRSELEPKPNPVQYEFNFPSNLKKLTLNSFSISWDEFSNLGRKLPNLEVLKTERTCKGGTWAVMAGDFPNLRYLKIKGNSDINEWLATGESFPKLEQLHLESLFLLKEIPCCFEDAVCLRMITVTNCDPSLCESAKRIGKVQKEEGLNQEFVAKVRSGTGNSKISMRSARLDLEQVMFLTYR